MSFNSPPIKINKIDTVAGINGKTELKDGEFLECCFNCPQVLVLTKDATVAYVTDAFNSAIRKMDFVNRTVSTIGKGAVPPISRKSAHCFNSKNVKSGVFFGFLRKRTLWTCTR